MTIDQAMTILSAPSDRSVRDYPAIRWPLRMRDGEQMSVQASSGHYCSPRDDFGPYTKFEIGFPSFTDPRLEEYAENWETPQDTVYAQVPADLIRQILSDHGGPADDVTEGELTGLAKSPAQGESR